MCLGKKQGDSALLAQAQAWLWQQAHFFASRNPGTAAEDFFQEGAIALLRAARRYDPARGSLINWCARPVRKAMTLWAGKGGPVAACAAFDRGASRFRGERAEVWELDAEADGPREELACGDWSSQHGGAAERRAEAAAALEKLPARLRALAWRVLALGEGLEAAGAACGIPHHETARRAIEQALHIMRS